jgi:hypothetical protein
MAKLLASNHAKAIPLNIYRHEPTQVGCRNADERGNRRNPTCPPHLDYGVLLGIVARDLKDSEAKDVLDDWRFASAYNAALQAATGESPLPLRSDESRTRHRRCL